MNAKQVREWLMKAWSIDREIKTLQEAYLNIYKQWISTAENLGKVDTGIKKNLMSGKVFEAFTKLGEELSESYITLWGVKREIIIAIEKVPDGTLRTLLFLRFVNYKTWEQVASQMNYSYSNILHNLYPEAVEQLQKVLENQPKEK